MVVTATTAAMVIMAGTAIGVTATGAITAAVDGESMAQDRFIMAAPLIMGTAALGDAGIITVRAIARPVADTNDDAPYPQRIGRNKKHEGWRRAPQPAKNRSTNICSAGTPEARARLCPLSIMPGGPHR